VRRLRGGAKGEADAVQRLLARGVEAIKAQLVCNGAPSVWQRMP
jgi:hypothetical protein